MQLCACRHAHVVASIVLAGAACTAEVETPLPNPNGRMDDRTGAAVAIDSNWALSGAPASDTLAEDGGKVLVYRRTAGSWPLAQTLVPSSPNAFGRFGMSLDLSGARAIVGAREGSPTSTGAAYIFERSGPTWTQVARLIGDTLATYFGTSVAISGDYAVVGAPGPAPASIVGPGVAYVYRRVSAWLRDTTLRASDAVSYMEFGVSVAIDGDVILIGARGDDVIVDAAYVFRRSAGTWIEEAKLTPLDPPFHQAFGSSVSLSRGMAVIGAPRDDAEGTGAGAGYVFERDSLGAWLQVQKLIPAALMEGDHFGQSVSVDYPHAVTGAPGGFDETSTPATAFIYQRGNSGWAYVLGLTHTGGEFGDAFASSVSVSGTCAMVGAPEDDIGGVLRIGAAYIYCLRLGTAPEIDIICCWTPPIGQPVVVTIRYRNPGTERRVGRRRVELMSPTGQVVGGAASQSITLSGGQSVDEQIVVPTRGPLQRGRHELRLRWHDAGGERIQRAYFAPPASNQAALGGVRR